jgi:hypothetical protein
LVCGASMDQISLVTLLILASCKSQYQANVFHEIQVVVNVYMREKVRIYTVWLKTLTRSAEFIQHREWKKPRLCVVFVLPILWGRCFM